MAADSSFKLKPIGGSGWKEFISRYTFEDVLPSYPPSDKLENIMWVQYDEDVFPIFYNHHYSSYSTKSGVAIVFFHGNGCDLGDNITFLKTLSTITQCSIYSIEYPGYGSSPGVPDESSVNKRMIRGLSFISEKFNIPLKRMILMGHSIGAAVLLGVVSENEDKFAGVFIINAFSSIKDIASEIIKQHFPLGFMGNLAGSAFDNLSIVKSLKHIPLYIYHCKNDRVIPVEQAHKLFEASQHLKQCYLKSQAGGTHNDFEKVELRNSVSSFVIEIQDEIKSTPLILPPRRVYSISPTDPKFNIKHPERLRKSELFYLY